LASTPHHAAKWTVGGFTESLVQELSPFGVTVCALEPGGMRTNWGARANQDTPELLPDYEPSVGAVAKALKSYWGKEVSDPVKVAQVVLRLPAGDSLPAHLLICSDAVRIAAEAEKTRRAEAAQWREGPWVAPTRRNGRRQAAEAVRLLCAGFAMVRCTERKLNWCTAIADPDTSESVREQVWF
jgi:NAD(P)-dependent dehydrogenase (short-subunit alcohol dehydrogenase family)